MQMDIKYLVDTLKAQRNSAFDALAMADAHRQALQAELDAGKATLAPDEFYDPVQSINARGATMTCEEIAAKIEAELDPVKRDVLIAQYNGQCSPRWDGTTNSGGGGTKNPPPPVHP